MFVQVKGQYDVTHGITDKVARNWSRDPDLMVKVLTVFVKSYYSGSF